MVEEEGEAAAAQAEEEMGEEMGEVKRTAGELCRRHTPQA